MFAISLLYIYSFILTEETHAKQSSIYIYFILKYFNLRFLNIYHI